MESDGLWLRKPQFYLNLVGSDVLTTQPLTKAPMAQAVKPTALVVENDEMQRTLVSMLLEEGEMYVIQCDSAEAAVHVLDQWAAGLSIVLTDLELAGTMDGIELACIVRQRFPNLHIIVTSDTPRIRRLPDGTTFMAKPWSATDVLLEARKSLHCFAT